MRRQPHFLLGFLLAATQFLSVYAFLLPTDCIHSRKQGVLAALEDSKENLYDSYYSIESDEELELRAMADRLSRSKDETVSDLSPVLKRQEPNRDLVRPRPKDTKERARKPSSEQEFEDSRETGNYWSNPRSDRRANGSIERSRRPRRRPQDSSRSREASRRPLDDRRPPRRYR